MEQNDRLEKNKDFFQGKELFNTKLLPYVNVGMKSGKITAYGDRQLIQECLKNSREV